MSDRRLNLVMLWHMHQPDYRDHMNGEHVLPWVYLHALKDYTDMADHLERHPGIRTVVNFVPVLLDQIEDYCAQFASGEFRDPLLRLLATQDLSAIATEDRRLLLETCFLGNHSTMLSPFPHYRRLHDLYKTLAREGSHALAYLSGAYFSDLITWYHLAWTGESERRRQPLVAELMSRGEAYSHGDRLALVELIGRTMHCLIPRYRALRERGQIELSATPETHPLAPLLIDFNAARESQAQAPLPQASLYPGGRQRVDAQIQAGMASHQRRFGAAPVGMWPAEGAISTPVVREMALQGCRWLASGEGVLRNSLALHGIEDPRATYHPWCLAGAPDLALFFRDEQLSDLIGFEYAKWHGRDAAADLVRRLESILAAAPAGEDPVVSIILDGENAWEHYPYNGFFFFDDLYGLLERHTTIRTTTYADLLARRNVAKPVALPSIVAGSWVYGTLSTWIGDTDKNRAWDLLCAAKQAYDLVTAGIRLSTEEKAAAARQLAICESSDWFWWFGDYNPAQAVASFDGLFRRNLASLYQLLKLTPPDALAGAISRGSHTAEGGAMRRAT